MLNQRIKTVRAVFIGSALVSSFWSFDLPSTTRGVMSKKAIPDAWDDDWESQADRLDKSITDESSVKLSKAERLAKHAESNKKLWHSADAPSDFHHLQAREDVPLKSEFKPAVTVLSRKPTTPSASRSKARSTGGAPDSDDDDEDADQIAKRTALSAEERRLKAQQDREEKQRRYNEVRGRLFADGSVATATDATSSRSSAGNVTPPLRISQTTTSGTVDSRGGRTGRAGRGGKGKETGMTKASASLESSTVTPPQPRVANALGTDGAERRQLYVPDMGGRLDGNASLGRRPKGTTSSRSLTPEVQQPIRAPKGPDGSGRGGFGFAMRGQVE
ncbi:MAG: hypothetical protein M1817_001619 [Caeruleum heppii]|nr:MAG: hypothetical protein M1817_001619 [Caeruleum heppii]